MIAGPKYVPPKAMVARPFLNSTIPAVFSTNPLAPASSISRTTTGFSWPEKTSARSPGQALGQPAQQLHPVQPGQLGVEHEEVGLELEAHLQARVAVAALADQLVVLVGGENLDQHLADRGLVLNNY